jgi:8-hydroxy-5-deazaflavin:NADPH oxidoreductase
MRIGILGTGTVGTTLGTKLVELGHDVKMGSRSATNEKAVDWAKKTSSTKASYGTFADAASFGEIMFNCTLGQVSLEALKMAGAQNLRGKVLIDVSNPLDFSKGMPPTLTVSNTDSVGEQIQRAFPDVKVVKSLNTISAPIMINPKLLQGDTDIFVCGNDSEAKAQVQKLLEQFGWKNIVDLGDISAARGTEMWLALWVRLMMKFQNPMFNIHIHKAN